MRQPERSRPGGGVDPGGGGRPVVVLVDATSPLEDRLVADWVAATLPGAGRPDLIPIRSSRRPRARPRTDPALAARLQRGDDPWVVPVRVAWLAPERRGRRSASWGDLLRLGDPRDPGPLRQRLILARHPERVEIVSGKGASASELVEAHGCSVEVMSLEEMVARRAHLALERAERPLRGNRYKVPKFLHEEILGRAAFRDGVLRIATREELLPEVAFRRARRYLREIAASHSPFLIDLIANAIHWVYRQGYGAIRYDPASVAEIARLGQEHPLAFLPSHRSNLDRLSLQYLLWENDLPPNHTAAGINMNFFPVGPLIRRTGAFFIRRSFAGKPLYKFVLRAYLDYLVEKRFPLEWYLEGGRSRSGKLLPPRYGLLGWVVDAVRRGKADDLYLVPISIAYDQIQDVGDYANEARGGEKQKESFGWALSAIRSLRRRYGDIHVRFAEPISVSKEVAALAGDPDAGEVDLDLRKLAFEVLYRIGSVTPVTPTAVASIALLAEEGRTLGIEEIAANCAALQRHLEERDLPTTERLRLDEPGRVRAVLRQMAALGAVTELDGGAGYRLDGDQPLRVAYYRNMVVHFFVPGAIAELALLGSGDLWDDVDAVRDLLKFEFFFPERSRFQLEIEAELAASDPDWGRLLEAEGGRRRLLAGMPIRRAHWALLPFLEAYRVVADELSAAPPRIEEADLLDACLERGGRYLAEGEVSAAESVSKALFSSALDLCRNRGLLGPGAGSEEERASFAAEVGELRRRALAVGELGTSPPR